VSITRNPIIPAGAYATVGHLLGRMRTSVCTVQRPRSGINAAGSPVAGFATVAVVPCRVVASGRIPVETVTGGRFGPVADYELFFSPDADVRSQDRIITNGATLNVVADQDAVSHGFQLKVIARVAES